MTRFKKHKLKHRLRDKMKDWIFYTILIAGMGFLVTVAAISTFLFWCTLYGH